MKKIITSHILLAFLAFITPSIGQAQESPDPLAKLATEVERLRQENERQQAQIEALLTQLQQLRGDLTRLPSRSAPESIEAPEKPELLVKAPAEPKQNLFLGTKWETNLYGFIKLDAIYHDGRVNNEHIGTFALSGEDSPFSMTAKETRIGLTFKGEREEATIQGALEVDFYADTNPANQGSVTARTRRVYVDWALNNGWSFRAGRDWDTYIAVYPKNLNFNALGGQGWPWARRDHLRATYQSGFAGGELLVAASATASAGGPGDDLPAFQGKLQYSRPLNGGKLLLAVSGAWDEDAINTGEDRRLDADLLALSLSLPLSSRLKLEGMLFTGQTLGGPYHGGINQATYRNLGTGRLEALRTIGGFAQLHFQATPSLALSSGFGVDNPDADANWAPLTHNQTAFINAYYELFGGLFLATELQHIQTEHSTVTSFSPDGKILSRETSDEEALRWQNSVIFRF
jgi:hypothetical protein